MKNSRRGPALFEVMSKAPQGQSPVRRPLFTFSGRSKTRSTSAPVAAQALTEQEAAAELAAGQREAQEKARAAAQAIEAEAKARRQLEKEAAKLREELAKREAVPPANDASPSNGGWLAVKDGRLVFSIGSAGWVAAAGLICAVSLTAYSFGRRSQGLPVSFTPASAVAAKSDGLHSPLLPNTTNRQSPARKDPRKQNPDLSHLLDPPAKTLTPPAVIANKAVSASQEPTNDKSLQENHSYLQIESFRISRERNSEQLAVEVAEVQKYLTEKGVKTFARRRSNGFVLFAAEGVPSGRDHSAQRESFRKRVEQLGQEYRKAGGRYQFKGCLFVSYASAKAGEPV